jgi:hypothetical protein
MFAVFALWTTTNPCFQQCIVYASVARPEDPFVYRSKKKTTAPRTLVIKTGPRVIRMMITPSFHDIGLRLGIFSFSNYQF